MPAGSRIVFMMVPISMMGLLLDQGLAVGFAVAPVGVRQISCQGVCFLRGKRDAGHVGNRSLFQRTVDKCRDEVFVGGAVEFVGDVAQRRPGLQRMAVGT
ncbi:hypothetical protein D3C87_1691990 [compost metagenome]